MTNIFSKSELAAKAYLVATEKAGLLSQEDLMGALADINEEKKQAVLQKDLPSSFDPDLFEAIANVVGEVFESVVDLVASAISDS